MVLLFCLFLELCIIQDNIYVYSPYINICKKHDVIICQVRLDK